MKRQDGPNMRKTPNIFYKRKIKEDMKFALPGYNFEWITTNGT